MYLRTSDASTLHVMPERPPLGDVFAERLGDVDPPLRAEQGRVRRARRRRPHHAVAAAVAERRPPATPRHRAGARRRARPVDRLARRAVQRRTGRGGDHAAHVVRGAGTVAHRRAAARLAERRRRLQDPLRPGDAARPVEDRRRDPLRAVRIGRPGRRADDRDDRRAAGMGAQPGHGDGVLLVGPGVAVVRRRRGRLGSPRRGGAPRPARADDRAASTSCTRRSAGTCSTAPSATPPRSPCSAASAPRCTSASCTSC